MLLNMKTRKAKTLYRREKGAGFVQRQDRFLGRIPNQLGAFLLEGTKSNNPKSPSVYAVTGAPFKLLNRAVQRPHKDVVSWRSDRLGNVRVGHGFIPDPQRGVLKLKDAQGTWHDVSALIDRGARVLALPTRDLNVYLVLTLPKDSVDGTGLRHVYEYNVSSGAEELAYAANHSEVASILMDLKGEEVVLVQYQDEALPPVIFHPLLKETYAALGARFSNAWIGLYDVSDDLSRALFVVNSPTVPGALYLHSAKVRELKGAAYNILAWRPQSLLRSTPLPIRLATAWKYPPISSCPMACPRIYAWTTLRRAAPCGSPRQRF